MPTYATAISWANFSSLHASGHQYDSGVFYHTLTTTIPQAAYNAARKIKNITAFKQFV